MRGIDKQSGVPPYKQIAADLRRGIYSGEYPEGDKLPSEAALMTQYGVARMTARQAVQQLRTEGLVVAEHGRGVFVRTNPAADVLSVPRDDLQEFIRSQLADGNQLAVHDPRTGAYRLVELT